MYFPNRKNIKQLIIALISISVIFQSGHAQKGHSFPAPDQNNKPLNLMEQQKKEDLARELQKKLNDRLWDAVNQLDTMRVRALIDSGADVNVFTGESYLLYRCISENCGNENAKDKQLGTARLLLRAGAVPDYSKSYSEYNDFIRKTFDHSVSCLGRALECKDTAMMHLLLDAGAKKLYYPSFINGIENNCIAMLLKYGMKDTMFLGQCLHTAANACNSELFKLLYSAKVSLEFEYSAETPLICAAAAGCDTIVSMILAYGVNVNKRYGRQSALHSAVEHGKTRTALLLLRSGADPNDKNGYGNRPIQIAINKHNVQLVKALIDSGLDINEPFSDGTTALSCAKDNVSNNEDSKEIVRIIEAARAKK
jgi:ankyrin repeat protein